MPEQGQGEEKLSPSERHPARGQKPTTLRETVALSLTPFDYSFIGTVPFDFNSAITFF